MTDDKVTPEVQMVVNAIFPILSRWAYAPPSKRKTTQAVAQEAALAAMEALMNPSRETLAGVPGFTTTMLNGWRAMLTRAMGR